MMMPPAALSSCSSLSAPASPADSTGRGDSGRGDSLPRALLRSLLAACLFWLCWTLALLAARTGVVPAPLPVWGVTVAALGLGLWRFRGIPE